MEANDEDDILAAAFGALGMGGLAMNPQEAADEIMRDLEWGGEGAAVAPGAAFEAEMAAPGGASAAAVEAPRVLRRSKRVANLQAAKAAAEYEAKMAAAAFEAEQRAARNAAAQERAAKRQRTADLKFIAVRVMELHGNETPDWLETHALPRALEAGEPDAAKAIMKLIKMKRIAEEQQKRPGFKEEVKEVLRGRIHEALSLGEFGAAQVIKAQLNTMKGGRKNRKTRRGKKRSTRRR